jgi:hypothetical protein
MKRIRPFVLLATLMLVSPLPSSHASSPLRYHTYMVAVIEASVKDIRLVDTSPMGPHKSSRERSPRSGEGMGKVQKISLKIVKVERIELNRTGSLIHQGDSMEVTNQYLDQTPPFAPGETIRVRVRLVLPEERYDRQDPRQQWWFFPQGEPEGILPPRLPFTGIQVVRCQ